MNKRRIKRNFDEQLAVVSSLAVTSPKSTTGETNSKKNRYWSYNKVWRRGESQKRESGGDPPGKVIPETQSQNKVTPVPPSQVKAKSTPPPEVKRGPPQTVRGWRYNRVWRKDRVWRRENLSISSAMASVTQSSVVTSVTQSSTSTDKTSPSAETSVTQSSVAMSVSNSFVGTSVSQPPVMTSVTRTPVVTSVTQSSASTSKTSSSAEVCVSNATNTNSASLTTEKTATSGTRESTNVKVLLPPVYDVPCKETQSAPLSGAEKTQRKTRPNRCSSRDKIPTADTLGVPPAAPPTAGDRERPDKSLKRKRIESQTTTSKRIQLEHSAADSQLTSASYRFLWSMETLFEELCLVFEDVRL